MLQQILITGLVSGGVFALLALGFSLVFGVARIVNLGHTAFYMAGAFFVYYLVVERGLSAPLASVVAVTGVALLALVIYRLIMAPVHAFEATMLILTVGIALAFEALILIMFGGHYRGAPALVTGATAVGGVRVPNQQLLALAIVAAALVVVWFVLSRTRLGTAIRAVANDREVANLMGIDVARVESATVALSAGLAAMAGVVIAPMWVLEPLMWTRPLIVVLAIVVLGGLGSIKGSLIGAFVLAFAETLVVFLVPKGAFLRGAVSLAVMLGVLLIRPEGLFGVHVEGER